MNKYLIALLLLPSIQVSTAIAEEEQLSPAELALQAQMRQQKATQFKGMCERMIIHGADPERATFIANLNGKTCAEVAQEIEDGTTGS